MTKNRIFKEHQTEKKVERSLNNISFFLKKLGAVEDIAKVVYFLDSDVADYVVGQVINVEGGMVM